VYSERGVLLPVLTSGGEFVGVRACKNATRVQPSLCSTPMCVSSATQGCVLHAPYTDCRAGASTPACLWPARRTRYGADPMYHYSWRAWEGLAPSIAVSTSSKRGCSSVFFPGSRVTTDQRAVAKQEIQDAEQAKRAGAPYAHHRNQAKDTNTKLRQKLANAPRARRYRDKRPSGIGEG
jgi:hypothetical protein